MKPAGNTLARFLANHLRTQQRRQRQRQETGEGDRPDHCRRQFAERQAGRAREEHHRHENGANHRRGGKHGKTHLARTLEGSGQRRLALLRSEEHTSELQSLMRISYAVFCLKKKNKSSNTSNPNNKTLQIDTKINTTM